MMPSSLPWVFSLFEEVGSKLVNNAIFENRQGTREEESPR